MPAPTRTRFKLPLRPGGVLTDGWIRREQHTIMLAGLVDEHPIERVTMQRGKPREPCPSRSYRDSIFHSQICSNNRMRDRPITN